MNSFVIRPAVPGDEQIIYDFICKLADYEKLRHLVVTSPGELAVEIFEKKRACVLIAMEGDREVGFALYFYNFSTFLGRAGIYLEDLFVLPEYRGRGYGKALLKRLAAIALEEGCGRLEWSCLDWNTPSIEFYTQVMHAAPMDGWSVYRLTGRDLELAGQDG